MKWYVHTGNPPSDLPPISHTAVPALPCILAFESGLTPPCLLVCATNPSPAPRQIPDINPYVADAKWLQGQHLLATIRRRAGTLVGHAEIPLADAFTMMTHPLGSGELTLAVVLEHPLLAKAFKAHVHRELSSENLEFFRAVQSFKQDATSGISGKELAERADAVMEYCRAKKGGMFDSDGGGQVLLTSRTQRRLQESMKKDINANMFDEAVADVFRLMERDSFPRFLKSFKFGEGRRHALPAPLSSACVSACERLAFWSTTSGLLDCLLIPLSVCSCELPRYEVQTHGRPVLRPSCA